MVFLSDRIQNLNQNTLIEQSVAHQEHYSHRTHRKKQAFLKMRVVRREKIPYTCTCKLFIMIELLHNIFVNCIVGENL